MILGKSSFVYRVKDTIRLLPSKKEKSTIQLECMLILISLTTIS